MQTIPIESEEYADLRDELRDPEIKTKAAIPLLEKEMREAVGIYHTKGNEI